jgi:hypothetical protein
MSDPRAGAERNQDTASDTDKQGIKRGFANEIAHQQSTKCRMPEILGRERADSNLRIRQ